MPLRAAIGIVPQDTPRCCVNAHDRVQHRLRSAWRASRHAEIVAAAAPWAHIHDFIESLPDGYRTGGERGLKLSGGEKQRVASPHAAENPADLVLDGPPRPFDRATERVIRRAGESRPIAPRW